MARTFDKELNRLREQITTMASNVKDMIRDSITALKAQDMDLAERIVKEDARIDEMELQTDEMCHDLIALRQPVAQDLRFITMAMKISTDLERIADLAVDIAQRVKELGKQPLLKPLVDIPKLSELAQEMVRDSVLAFTERDSSMAKKVVLSDDKADNLRNQVQQELINDYMAKYPSTVSKAVTLLLVARYLERICDHATNIAEDVIYLVDAKVVKHHPELLGE